MSPNKQTIDDIEDVLRNLNGNLRRRTREQQREALTTGREDLGSAVNSLIGSQVLGAVGFTSVGYLSGSNVISSVLESAVGVVGAGVSSVAGFSGAESFRWSNFEESNYNASLADPASSDPHLYNAMMKAGEIFEQVRSLYLMKESDSFRGEVTSAHDADKLAESIIAFCKVLTVAYNGCSMILLLDMNDIKILLQGVIKMLLNSSNMRRQIRKVCSQPIISEGRFAWVKYEFSSDHSIESSCCSTKKVCDVNVAIKHYCFPGEAEFRAALKEAEKQLQK